MFTVIGELVQQDHPAVRHCGAAVTDRRLNDAEDFSTRHISGNGKHVDSGDVDAVFFSGMRKVRGHCSKCAEMQRVHITPSLFCSCFRGDRKNNLKQHLSGSEEAGLTSY